MRATSQNPQVAGLMGIDINNVISFTFVIGAALGAIAGVMVGTYYGIAHYQMGFLLGLKAFSAAVLGGIGNLARRGAGRHPHGPDRVPRRGLRGRLHQRLLPRPVPARLPRRVRGEPRSRASSARNYKDVYAFIVLILVLVFRPSGLLGERVGDRA